MPEQWYCVEGDKQVGPLSRDELARKLLAFADTKTLVWRPGFSEWIEAGDVPGLLIGSASYLFPIDWPRRDPPLRCSIIAVVIGVCVVTLIAKQELRAPANSEPTVYSSGPTVYPEVPPRGSTVEPDKSLRAEAEKRVQAENRELPPLDAPAHAEPLLAALTARELYALCTASSRLPGATPICARSMRWEWKQASTATRRRSATSTPAGSCAPASIARAPVDLPRPQTTFGENISKRSRPHQIVQHASCSQRCFAQDHSPLRLPC